MAYHRFQIRSELPAHGRELLESIPGLRVSRSGVSAPRNVAWLVQEILDRAQVPYSLTPPRAHRPRGASSAVPYLQPWVIEPGFLMAYQREAIQTILSFPGECGSSWAAAGAGKSLIGIIWALAVGPGLTVVATKAAIRGTWAREIDTYTKGVRWEVLESRSADLATLGDLDPAQPTFLITAYDTLPSWIHVLEAVKPRSLILDEVHTIKSNKRWNAEVDLTSSAEDDDANAGAESAPPSVPEPKVTFSLKDNRAAAAYRLSRCIRRRLGLTATPISDRVRDLWAQLDLIHPWEWGGFYPFCRRYAGAVENSWGGIDTRGKSNLDELKKRTAYVTHRVPFSVANRNLPPKRRLVTYVKVSEQCRPEGFSADLRKAMQGATSSGEGRARLTEMLLMEAAARKRKIVEAWVSDAVEAGQKVIVFTGRRRDCARMGEELSGKLKGIPVWHGDGSTPMGEPRDPQEGTRYWIMDRYMEAPGPAVLIGTGDAWGEGLNLQRTDLLIQAMLPYTPRQIIQREGRVCRLGQDRPVLIRYPICEGTIDEHVCTILLEKLPAVEKATQSDEIAGLDRELIGASEEELIGSMLDKMLGGTK